MYTQEKNLHEKYLSYRRKIIDQGKSLSTLDKVEMFGQDCKTDVPPLRKIETQK